MRLPMDIVMFIDGIRYEQKDGTNVKEGDLVFDIGDMTYGYCYMRKGDRIAIKHYHVAEVGVHIDRVRILVPSLKTNSEN